MCKSAPARRKVKVVCTRLGRCFRRHGQCCCCNFIDRFSDWTRASRPSLFASYTNQRRIPRCPSSLLGVRFSPKPKYGGKRNAHNFKSTVPQPYQCYSHQPGNASLTAFWGVAFSMIRTCLSDEVEAATESALVRE